MANSIRLKRRSTGGAAGAPSSLLQAEPAFNEVDQTLYIGIGTQGANGTATSIIPIAGPGAYVDRTSAQTISGLKAFNSIPTAPTPTAGDSSTNVATTAFVTTATTLPSVAPNVVLAGPSSGSTNAQAAYRALTAADLPIHTTAKLSDFNTASDARISLAAGQTVCPLDSNKLVPAAFLPSYVDDVLEFDTLSVFPATGEKGKIYIDDATNWEYRWSGSAYIRIVASPGTTDALAEGTQNLYFTTARVLATVLQGLSLSSSVVVAASDSILGAIGKLQAQVSLRLIAANNLSDLTAPATARTNLGLGTIATQNASLVAITGGTINNIDLDGGAY